MARDSKPSLRWEATRAAFPGGGSRGPGQGRSRTGWNAPPPFASAPSCVQLRPCPWCSAVGCGSATADWPGGQARVLIGCDARPGEAPAGAATAPGTGQSLGGVISPRFRGPAAAAAAAARRAHRAGRASGHGGPRGRAGPAAGAR